MLQCTCLQPFLNLVKLECSDNCSYNGQADDIKDLICQLDGNISLNSSIYSSASLPEDCSETVSEKIDENNLSVPICQLDGNIFSNSSLQSTPFEDDLNHSIQVIIGNRPTKKVSSSFKRIPVRKVIRRDNRGELSLFLPNMAVYNHRSIWKKLNNFCVEFHEMQMGIAFHSEVWERKENKKQKFRIEEMLEMQNISYISTPRPNRRGGGSAITCDDTLYHLKEIKVHNPDNLEVTFATVRPRDENSSQFIIILCAVYSPPRSRKKSKLIDFISNTYNYLKSSKYPSAYFALGGDINDLKVDNLLEISPMFQQIVTLPTRGLKTLSVIITDLWDYYQKPEILPPLMPDRVGVGKPSDHSVPFARTCTDRAAQTRKNFTVKTIRPFPESGVSEFGRWLVNTDFSDLESAESSTDKVDAFNNCIATKTDAIFPPKEIKIYEGDKEWMTPQLRKLRRQKSREYRNHKGSAKFKQLQKEFLEAKEINSREYIQKKVEELKNSNLRKFYTKIKEAGSRLGECRKDPFAISSHVEQNLNPDEAAEKIAKHFSSISKEFPPLDATSLPERVKMKIFHQDVSRQTPKIEEFEVFQMFKKRGFKSCSVPGDIPSILKKEFAPEFAGPVAEIFNAITRSGQYPRQWVTEYVTPIPKVTPPENEDDLRNISLTADLSKDYENFLAEWLFPFISKRIDPGQFGGLKGHSTSHYLISLYDFIASHTDSSKIPTAVNVALVDFSKAFNRINHAKVIIRLSDWGVPGWLLRILISYLTGRSMILRYKGTESLRHLMPGGSPQGALLGVILYLIYVSDIGMDLPEIPALVPGCVDLPTVPFPPNRAVSEKEARLKYVDDLSLAESMFLGNLTLQDDEGLFLPPADSLLQNRLDDLVTATRLHDMKLNHDKTKIISFSFSRKYPLNPVFSVSGQPIEVVKQTKLLGVILSDNCKWDANTKNIVKSGNSRLWFLRRLKTLGASVQTLLDIYKLFCRSVLEYGAPVWSGALTKRNIQDIERVQQNAMRIIFGAAFTTYDDCLEQLEEQTLEERRTRLCLTFAQNCLKTEKFSSWFPKGIKTRNGTHFCEEEALTKRYRNSAIPHLTRLLNINLHSG